MRKLAEFKRTARWDLRISVFIVKRSLYMSTGGFASPAVQIICSTHKSVRENIRHAAGNEQLELSSSQFCFVHIL